MAIYVAMAIALDYIKEFIPFLNMPSGGSINIALIPIVMGSFHLGTFDGIAIGLLWWLVSSIMGLNPYYVSLLQYICDYIIPSGIVGLSAVFYGEKKSKLEIVAGIVLAMSIRTFFIVLSGAIFWADGVAQGSNAAWLASLIYNGPYSLATLLMLLLITPALIRKLHKLM